MIETQAFCCPTNAGCKRVGNEFRCSVSTGPPGGSNRYAPNSYNDMQQHMRNDRWHSSGLWCAVLGWLLLPTTPGREFFPRRKAQRAARDVHRRTRA